MVAPMDTVVVRVARIVSARSFGTIFSGPRGDREDGPPVTIRAPAAAYLNPPVEGETWSATGRWVTTRYGAQFEAARAHRLKPHGRLIVSFLAARIPGVGPTRAQRLWDALGHDLERILDEGDVAALSSVLAPAHPTLSARLASVTIETWRQAAAEGAVFAWLEQRGVQEVAVANRIVRILGDGAVAVLEENPYVLLSLMTWPVVDRLGLRLLREDPAVQNAEGDERRLVGAVDAVVHQHIDAGNTLVSDPDLRSAVAGLLGVRASDAVVAQAVRLGLRDHAIRPHGDHWRAPGCALLEDELTTRFRAMMTGAERSAVDVIDLSRVPRLLHGLYPEQAEAVLAVLGRPLSVLTGGAGVGKTTTVQAVCNAWEALGGTVVLCALSGKAAVVLSRKASASGRPRLARTIQRLLLELASRGRADVGEGAGDDGEAVRLDDRTLLVVDEAGMVGLGDWHRLVMAMPVGCRLLMVGDTAQLPPISMGLVFHRLAQLPQITAELVTVRRQDGSTGIPAIAASIRARTSPDFTRYAGRADGVSFLAVPEAALRDAVLRVATDLGGFEPGRRTLQILSAVNRRHPASVRALNLHFHHQRVVQSTADTAAPALVVKGRLGQQFAVGDPVIHLRNNYDIGLFNGSHGWVQSIDADAGSLLVDFDGVSYEFTEGTLLDLALAYALTCHKAQGSEAERVIVPLFPNPLLDPSWLYTAITRAERQVVLIGEADVFQAAIGRTPAYERRRVGFLNDVTRGRSAAIAPEAAYDEPQ